LLLLLLLLDGISDISQYALSELCSQFMNSKLCIITSNKP